MKYWGLCLALIFYTSVFAQKQASGQYDFSNVKADEIVIKIKPITNPKAQRIFDTSRPDQVPFGKSSQPLKKGSKTNSILSGIYKIKLDEGQSVEEAIKAYQELDNIIYAEPIHLEKLLYVPNDTLANPVTGSQAYLDVIRAYDAWDITKGDSSIIIGISDTGVDFEHQDIAPKIFTNTAEIINGVDDDENGFIDDRHGYDFANNDADAQCVENFHGNRVAGLAGAATDNVTGMAGIGFNTSISPLKVFPDGVNLAFAAYDGIVYAADNGYDIINLSWGSAGTYSQFNQDLITYAVVEKNLLVVAAAGNSNQDEDFYPSSYDHVLSVGFTDNNDNKAPTATYSYKVDLVAPGWNLLSSFKDNTYATNSGSSYASPIVAGAAALVKDIYPDLKAEQIGEILRVTTDDIYEVGNNMNYEGKLGSGRLNIYKALTQDSLRSVRASNIEYTGSLGEHVFFGDSVSISFDLTNYLAPIKSGQLTLSSPSDYVSFSTEPIPLSFSQSMQSQTHSIGGLQISQDTPPETEIPIKFTFKEGSYEGFQYFKLTTAPDYLDMDNHVISLTIGGNGDLGHPTQDINAGSGLRWKNMVLADRIGLVLGNSKDSISDNAPQAIGSSQRDRDFITQEYVSFSQHEVADHFAYSSFTDDTISNSLGLRLEQKSYAFEGDGIEGFIILEYRIVNTQNDSLKNLSAGLFSDWKLSINDQNRALLDEESGIAYAFHSDSSLFSGFKIFGINSPIAQSLDLADRNGNTQDIGTVLSDSLKHELISKGHFDSAGWMGSGNDIAQLISTGTFDLAPLQSRKVTFFVAGGNSFEELANNISAAEIKYSEILNNPPLARSFVSCEGGSLKVNPGSNGEFKYYSDPLGMGLIFQGDSLATGTLLSDTSFYFQSPNGNLYSDIQRLDVMLVDEVADFTLSTDTLYLDNSINLVSFTDKSFEAVSWNWNFGNGSLSNLQNPSINFTEPDTYQISLNMESAQGCQDTKTKVLVVAERPPLPDIENQTVCPNEPVTLATASDSMAVYMSETGQSPVYRGVSYTTDELTESDTLYVSRISGNFESLKKPVVLVIEKPQLGFTYLIDTASAEQQIILLNTSEHTQSVEWWSDGASIGNSDSLGLLISETSYEITLKGASPLGCLDSITKTLTFSQSPKPTFTFNQPCAGNNFTIAPSGGGVFGFYDSETLDHLIAKGRQLTLDSLVGDTAIYVVGLDNVLPSEYLEVYISPQRSEFNILADPDTLILAQGKSVQLSVESTSVTNWKWYLDDVLIGTLNPIEILIQEPGTHKIRLEDQNIAGCISATHTDYVVLAEKPESALSNLEKQAIKILPNPTNGIFRISGANGNEVEIMDLSGKMLIRDSHVTPETRFDLSGYGSGVLLIRVRLSSGMITRRLVLK